MITDDYPEALRAHDDRCDYPLGGPCNCHEWERFDEDRAETYGCLCDVDLCWCDEELTS